MLGFELAIPVNNPELKLSNAGILFTTEHVPVLLASILPSIVLIVTLRLKSLARLTKGWTENALYVPWFVLTVAAIFWIVVGAKGQANAQGMTQLSSQGWLFALQQPISGHGLGTSWNYWNLFDFRLVAWSAIPHAAKNIALVVIIGVLNLPIWVPALGMVLKEPHFDVDRELLGHGISNIISGAVGTLPNLVVLSFSRLFTFAGGGRPEGLAVAGFSLVVFFTAGRLLPYIPTIVASIMVYYVGLDLMIEAWWVSMQELAWGEWLVVLGTSAACTALGFLEGVGTGLGLALLAYFFAHMLRSRPTLTTLPLARDSKQARLRLDDTTVSLRSLHNSSEVTLLPESLPEIKEKNQDNQNEVSVVSVSGNLSFANVPLLERRLSDAVKQHNSESIVLDVTKVTSCETCVPQMLLRIFTLYNMLSSTPPFVLAGLHPGSGAAADMLRGGVQCRWPEIQSVKEEEDGAGKLPAYLDLPGALNAVRKHQFPLSQAFEHGVAEEIRAVMDGESGLNTLSQISKQASVRILRDGSGTVYKLEKGDTLPLSSKYQNLTQMSKY